jgi:hypothetical protein
MERDGTPPFMCIPKRYHWPSFFHLTSKKNGKTTLNLKGSVPWNFSGMHSDDDIWKFILSKVHGTDDDDK